MARQATSKTTHQPQFNLTLAVPQALFGLLAHTQSQQQASTWTSSTRLRLLSQVSLRVQQATTDKARLQVETVPQHRQLLLRLRHKQEQ
jgi:hypothetical protein